MSGIYGTVRENPRYPIDDERRFTVQIKPHHLRPTPASPYRGQYDCRICPLPADKHLDATERWRDYE